MSEDQHRPNEPTFSLYEFKKWLTDQTAFPDFRRSQKEEIVSNYRVESRIGISRLKDQITDHNPSLKDVESLAEMFKEKGGLVTSSDGIHLTICIGNSEFKLPKIYTKES